MEIGETLYIITRKEWRKWLSKHHQDKKEIWLIYYKKGSGKRRIAYDDAVEEAICYGWINSVLKRISKWKYASRFSPRQKRSKWYPKTRERALKMLRKGKMTTAGIAVLPPDVLKMWNKGTK